MALKPSDIGLLIGYAVLMCAVTGAMFFARHAVLEESNLEADAERWDKWRDEAKKQADGQGPVRRREVKSDLPPAQVLLADYFYICLVGLLLLSSVLYAVMALLVRGALSAPARRFDRQE